MTHLTTTTTTTPQTKSGTPPITLTAEARDVLRLMEYSDQNIFLTGRAGTGKSTLLQHFCATTKKHVVVLAPTGVAALNVRGQTIHSFFRFRLGITPDDVKNLRVREPALYRKLDTIVIDEVSMVRADLLDCVNAFLKRHGRERGRPFGGVHMIVIGDLYQLPPVVPQEEQALFTTYYASPYFFDAHALKTGAFRTIELTTVYRQKDADFVAILDAVRTCTLRHDQLALLNQQCAGDTTARTATHGIHLVPTNAMADRINEAQLARISAKAVTFTGTITGEFNSSHLPTSERLTVKEGARIMMLANDSDGHWVNGDLGAIVAIDEKKPGKALTVALENGYRGTAAHYRWEVIRFFYNDKTERIESQVIGSFTQYPIRLAWAVTIHKAQGQTFETVQVDFGRGTFAHGQAYVALSRCTTLRGLRLTTPLEHRHIFLDQRVAAFLQQAPRPS